MLADWGHHWVSATDCSEHFLVLTVPTSPLIGGSISHPLPRFSNIFPEWSTEFLLAYPYALPCIVSSIVTIVTVITVSFSLKESLPSKRRATEKRAASPDGSSARRPGAKRQYGSVFRPTPTSTLPPLSADTQSTHVRCVGDSAEVKPVHDFSITGLLANKAIRTLCASSFFMAFIAMGYDVIFVLFAYSYVSFLHHSRI